MATRRVTEHQAKSRDGEKLQVVVIHQEGINKEQVKKENRYSKRHSVLVLSGHKFEFKEKRA
jgi:hypothetical protein